MMLLSEHSVTSLDVVHCGDAMVLCEGLRADSVDLIYTDPPYFRSCLWMYGWLAETAARVLKTGGWLLAMGGGQYADVLLPAMARYLTYHYTLEVALTGTATATWRPHGQTTPVIARTKPIYAFAKGRAMPRTVVYTPFAGDGNDKRWHHWGQDMKSARYFVDCFSQPGDLVLDPFVGGGTTAVVCKHLGRRYIGMDSDPAAVETTRGRLRNPYYAPRVTTGQLSLAFAR